MSFGRGSVGSKRRKEDIKYLEPGHVLDKQPTRKSIGHGQGWEDIVDETEERLSPGVPTVPRNLIEDCIGLARWG